MTDYFDEQIRHERRRRAIPDRSDEIQRRNLRLAAHREHIRPLALADIPDYIARLSGADEYLALSIVADLHGTDAWRETLLAAERIRERRHR